MKFEHKIYKNLVKYFIISFLMISIVFVLIYYFILMRVDRRNNKKEFDFVSKKFNEIIADNDLFIDKNKDDILDFINEKDSDFIEKVYGLRNKEGLDFSFHAYDKELNRTNSISFNNFLTKEKDQYIKILLSSFDKEKYYSYYDKGKMNLIYIKDFGNGSICLDISCASVENILNNYSKNFIISNSYNRVLAKGGNLSNISLNNSINDFKDSYLKREGDFGEFKVYNVQKKFFTKDLLYLVLFILSLVSFVYILIIIFFTKKISFEISKSINNLTQAIRGVSRGENDKIIIDSDDETKYIADNINVLIENVKKLEGNNVSLKYEKKASEFRTMESQFNPHFLYNTLDIISYQMYIDRDECQRLISNLSKLLRYSINNLSFLHLEEDLEYLNLYIAIQKIKYKNRMDLKINVEDDLNKVMVCKLFLEPLLENSFKYGFRDDNTIKIRINIYKKDDKVYIDTIDSGKALSKDEIDRINENVIRKSENSFLSDKHHGLENTLKRLKILYKDASLEFVENNFVMVRISFKV
ncbi:histidine kinase [Anaerococcus porci]|uniref:sensor histidine kinase n=1 Tax=Anaerococcus porci TaxID=2652269 RepID=UPI002A75AFCB|nr:histidine kinase [Anaerococcus porci]MDY3007250.1 histidine kinase [Anaerococcus porci]